MPGGVEEYCDYVYVLCLGRTPSLVEVREHRASAREFLAQAESGGLMPMLTRSVLEKRGAYLRQFVLSFAELQAQIDAVLLKPGALDDQRIPFDGGVWRYHPTKHIFESVPEGTTNPWGLDFDEWGQGFFSNSVTPHLYHVIPGAHYERRRESTLSRYAYERIAPCADHLHWSGKTWEESRGGTAAQVAVGGGHAHCGLMVYLGGAFPVEYRGKLFMVNIHGARLNVDVPELRGSGYVARHGVDFLSTSDPYFRGLHVKYGPEGAVYLSDWYDTGLGTYPLPLTGPTASAGRSEAGTVVTRPAFARGGRVLCNCSP